jgi:hypothetical protein
MAYWFNSRDVASSRQEDISLLFTKLQDAKAVGFLRVGHSVVNWVI